MTGGKEKATEGDEQVKTTYDCIVRLMRDTLKEKKQ